MLSRRGSQQNGAARDEKALRLLAGICSMMLTPDDRDHPFHPLWI